MQSGHVSSAARHCADLAYSGYEDWYLPSIGELDQIYDNRTTINPSATTNGGESLGGVYWSSTEDSAASSVAWTKSFINSGRWSVIKSNSNTVRAIRAF